MEHDPTTFRHDLDGVLTQRDPQALRAFLVERGQWPADTTMDPEAALWLMIAASPAHKALHAEARAWLESHGRSAEAAAIADRQSGAGGKPSGGKHRPPQRKPQGT